MMNCEHCGDRYGTTQATHHVKWNVVATIVADARTLEADVCEDHVSELEKLGRDPRSGISGVTVLAVTEDEV